MRNKYILTVLSIVAALAAVALVVSAGNPNTPPGPPETTSSYTLEHIYERLSTGAAGTPITFTEPISGPTVGTMHTLDEIYDLIGKRAWIPKTGQTISYTVGDDGDLETGVDWVASTRFITGTTGVVTDTLTGFVWLENANCLAFFSGDSTGQNDRSWSQALTATNSLASGYCGLTDGSSAGDWRLPNVRELQSLVDYGEYDLPLPDGHPFIAVQYPRYWSSTSAAQDDGDAWYLELDNGSVGINDKTGTYYVWSVRGGR